MITKDKLLIGLRKYIREHGSQKAAARTLGVSPSFLSDVLKGKREPAGMMLTRLGYHRVVMYAEIEKAQP